MQETREAKRAEFQQPIPTSEFALPVYAHPIPEQTPGPRLAPPLRYKRSNIAQPLYGYGYSAPAPSDGVAKSAPAQAYSAPAPSYRIEKSAPAQAYSASEPSYGVVKRAPSYSAPQPSYKRAYLGKPESYGIEKSAQPESHRIKKRATAFYPYSAPAPFNGVAMSAPAQARSAPAPSYKRAYFAQPWWYGIE